MSNGELDLLGSNKTTLVVLAGGRATRLLPISLNTPKCLLEINGLSVIEHIFHWAKLQGIDHIILALGHLGIEVENHVRKLSIKSQSIHYRYDLEANFGTANAVKNAAKDLNPDTQIAVVFGDSLLSLCLGEVARFQSQHMDKIVMTALPASLASEPANMLVRGTHLLGYPMSPVNIPPPTHTDYGLTIMSASCAQSFNKRDLKLELESRTSSGNVIAYEVSVPYIEIGTINSYENSKKYEKQPAGMEWMF